MGVSAVLCFLLGFPLVADHGPEQGGKGQEKEEAGYWSHKEVTKSILCICESFSEITLKHRAQDESQKERCLRKTCIYKEYVYYCQRDADHEYLCAI